MASLYITSIAPEAGKTAAAMGIAMLLASRGRKAVYAKPVVLAGQQTQASTDPDLAFCRRSGIAVAGMPVAAGAGELQGGLGGLKSAVQAALSQTSIADATLVIDGLTVAEGIATASADIAELAGAKVIGVVRYRRFMDLARVKALNGLFGGRLLGVILNAVPEKALRAAREEAAPELRQAGVPVLGILPEDRLLLGFSVAEYQARLGGRILNNEEHAQRIVESLLVGANVLDTAEPYYARVPNKALITRGSRPDLQWSSLETSTRCLILTEGVHPIPYVMDKAVEAEVPVMVVPKDTLDTIAAIGGFINRPSFHHPDKLARFAHLLDTHLTKGIAGLL